MPFCDIENPTCFNVAYILTATGCTTSNCMRMIAGTFLAGIAFYIAAFINDLNETVREAQKNFQHQKPGPSRMGRIKKDLLEILRFHQEILR